MEHYRSTLATTAAAVFALVTAAHVLHPGNYEVQPRPARPAATAWVDPPAERRVAAAPLVRSVDAPEPSVTSGLLAPQMTAALPIGETTVPTVPSAMAAPPARERKVAAIPRRKVAQHAARLRQASLDRGVSAGQPAAPRAEAPAPKAKVDPIGDLIRGLGLGDEG